MFVSFEKVTFRFGQFFRVLLGAAFSIFTIGASIYMSRDAWLKSREGIVTVATVTDFKQTYRSTPPAKYVNEHNISFDGLQKWLVLDEQLPIGTRFKVVYLKDDPISCEVFRNQHSFFGYLGIRWITLLLFLGLGIPSLYGTIIIFVRSVVLGEKTKY